MVCARYRSLVLVVAAPLIIGCWPSTAHSQGAADTSSGGQSFEAVDDIERATAILSAASRSISENAELVGLSQRMGSAAVAAFRDGRIEEAIPLFETILRIDEVLLPAGHPKIISNHHNLAFAHQRARHLEAAEKFYRSALKLRETWLPEEHPDIAINLADLGSLLANSGRPEEAEPLYERALAIREAVLGPNDPLIIRSLHQLADMYSIMGRYTDEEAALRKALAKQEASLPADHPDIAVTVGKLAQILADLGRKLEAEKHYLRALSVQETKLPKGDPATSTTMARMADVLVELGRFEDAEILHKTALTNREAVLGPQHPDTASSLHALGSLYGQLGRYSLAEEFLKRAIAIRESSADHGRVLASSLSRLARLYKDVGRHADSEILQKRALALRQKILPGDHPEISLSLDDLGGIYADVQRYDEAEILYRRSLAIRQQSLPVGHPLIRAALNNLALLYHRMWRYEKAEAVYREAIGGADPLEVTDASLAETIGNLADAISDMGRVEEAQALQEHVLRLMESSLPASHPSITTALNNLASTLHQRGDYAAAESMRRRVLVSLETELPRSHPNVIAASSSLAVLLADQGKLDEALGYSRATVEAVLERTDSREMYRGDFLHHASLALRLNDMPDPAFEAFAVHQWPMGGAAGTAIAAAKVRSGATDVFQSLVRRRDALLEQKAATDKLLSQALGAGGSEAKAQVLVLRQRYDAQLAELSEIDSLVTQHFPSYADLAKPVPLSVGETQALLGKEEALVSFMLTGDARIPGFVFAITADALKWGWIEDSREVMRLSRELRSAMDGGNRGAMALNTRLNASELRKVKITQNAHRLHELLLGPVRSIVASKRDLIIVPDPYLAELPMHMLVTEDPSRLNAEEVFRHARWLIYDHSVTVLPAVSSLKALRETQPNGPSASEPFMAFADPVIGSGGPMDCAVPDTVTIAAVKPDDRKITVARSSTVNADFRADVASIRRLARLPDTRCEALAIASALGNSDRLFFEADASETRLKALNESGDLARQRVILFATHGLAPGDLEIAEPGLVLTPPANATGIDDGLLTASEVAGLELNADFVILSACNTAAAGTEGGQSFSGLARAFFYAGAKSVLVSHWPVHSDAAVKLTTRALSMGTNISRAEAMRRSMLAMIDDDQHPRDADPVRWAPFSLVGGSGRY